jgi:hypothetical protein
MNVFNKEDQFGAKSKENAVQHVSIYIYTDIGTLNRKSHSAYLSSYSLIMILALLLC